MQVQLILKKENREDQVFPISVPAFMIGRGEGCHLRAGSSKVSPNHCVILTDIDGTVTIQDLGGENGTYVNGERVFPRRILADGDTIKVGRHVFIASIRAETVQPPSDQGEIFELASPDSVPSLPKQSGISSPPPTIETIPIQEKKEGVSHADGDIMFEVRYGGHNVSVTKDKLFALALKGDVLQDDLVTVNGTKIFADSIRGIVFGDKSSAVPPSTAYEVHQSTTSPAATTVAMEYDLQVPPHAGGSGESSSNAAGEHVYYTPPKEASFGAKVIEATMEKTRGVVKNLQDNDQTMRRIQVFFGIFVGVCLLAGLLWLYAGSGDSYGAVYVSGMIMLDEKSVEGVNVRLHPCCGADGKLCGENGRPPCGKENKLCGQAGASASGITKKGGTFTVTTRMARANYEPVKGALPGWYNVTFDKISIEKNEGENADVGHPQPQKVYVIPQRYERPETSGIKPVEVKAEGKNRFSFELTSQAALGGGAVLGVRENDGANSSRIRNIFEAAQRGTLQDVQNYFNGDVDINAKDNAGSTLLHVAAQHNPDGEILKYLIARGANVNAISITGRNGAGRTPLDVADTDEKKAIILEAGGLSCPRFGDIFAAAKGGTPDDIYFFLSQEGTPINAGDSTGSTLLHHAAQSNSTMQMLEFLITRGASVNAVNSAGKTPLELANTLEKKAFIRQFGGFPGSSRFSGDVFGAARIGTLDDVRFVLAQGVNLVHMKDDNGNTPLHIAAQFNRDLDVLMCLISQGAEVKAKNGRGQTPLDVASTPEKRMILSGR